MLKVAAHKTADVEVLGLSGHTGADAADSADDHVDADPRTAGLLELQDDVPVGDGVVLEDHGGRTPQTGGVDDPVHLIQKDALEAQRGHQHLFALFRQLLHGEVLEDIGSLLADAEVGGDEGVVGIKLTGLLVVVAGADLGDVGVAMGALFGDEGQLGVHLVVVEAVDDGASRFLEVLRPVDVVLLIKAGAQLHQRYDLLAVFGGLHEGLHDLGLPGHPVEGHLDGDDIGVLRGLFEHRNEGADGLVRIAQQHIMLFHLGCEVVVLRRQHGPGRRIEQLRVSVGLHPARELKEEAQVKGAFLDEDPLVGQLEAAAQQLRDLRRGRDDLQPHRGQLAAALEQVGHDLAVVDVMVHHPLFHVDVGVAGDPEEALFLHVLLTEDKSRIVEHQLFRQGKKRLVVLPDEVHPLHLARDGHNAEGVLRRVLFVEEDAEVDLLIAQEREGMAAVHDLGAEDGEKLALEILFPEMLVLLGQLIEVHLAVAAGSQIFQRLGVIFVAVLLKLGRLGHDGGKLLLRRHVGLILPLLLLAAHEVCPLLERADAHHEELVQIGAIDGQELELLGQRDIFILAQHQHAAVEIQPAQFPVDKDALFTHDDSSFLRGGAPLSSDRRGPAIRLSYPA